MPIAAAGALAIAMTAFLRSLQTYEPVTALRSAAVLLALGAAFLLDDASASLTAASPASRLFRRSLSVALGAVVVCGAWAAVVAYATAGHDGAPVARLSVELAALASVALVFSAVAARDGGGRGGIAGGPAVLIVFMSLTRLPQRWALLVGPGHPRWQDAGRDWSIVAVVGLAALIVLSLDPARRRFWRNLRTARTAVAGGKDMHTADQQGG